MALSTTDLLDLDSLLSDDQRAVRALVRRFSDEKVAPIAASCFRRGVFPRELVQDLAALGLFGANLEGYGCAGMDAVSYGLVMKELERAESGVRSFTGVQGNLVMYPLWRFGSDAQRERWLPALRTGDVIGCFGLSEPDAGSDPGAMRTRARKTATGWVLQGTKRWITNGTFANLAVIWARTGEDPKSIRAFLVERGAPGFTQAPITDKQSFRVSDTAELTLDDVEVSGDALLPGTDVGLKAALEVLNQGRYGIVWGVLGAAESCLETALSFLQERRSFGGPLAGKQLVQKRLADMAARLTHAQLVAMRIAQLKDSGRLQPVQLSLAKMTNVESALWIARTARELLGANGIMDDYPVMRHMCNLETIYTYEGTHDVHTLVVGQALTGLNAF